MRWEAYFINGKPFVVNNPKGKKFVYNLIFRMHFPHKTRDKRKRDALKKGRGGRKIIQKDVYSEFVRNYKSAYLAGEVFRFRCFFALCWDEILSVNFLDYAITRGFLSEWTNTGYPTGSLKDKSGRFKQVAHLWAALNHMAVTYENFMRTDPLDFVLFTPERFLGFASMFREVSLDIGLAEKRTELWMPKGWREKVADIPKPDGVEVPEQFDELSEKLRKLWPKYVEQLHYENCSQKPKK